MVGDDGGPAHVALTVFDQDIEERVQRVEPSLLGDRTEALADQRLVGALDDHCIVKVLVPQRRSELDAVELPTEPAAVLLVGQYLIALQLVSQVYRCGPRTELFEDR